MLRILIVDDHAVVRRGLRQILTEELSISDLGEAQDAEEALKLIWKHVWDLVILDINLPGRSGLEALTEIKQQRPELPVLILSVHPEDQLAVRILKSGASGYLTKDSAPEELAQAARKVLDGGRYVSANLAERLVVELQASADKQPHETLSDREYQVLCLIAVGKTVTEIASDLTLSVRTISTYHTRLLEKMRMNTNAELIAYAVRNHLVD